MTSAEATQLLADQAQELGADGADSTGIVRAIVKAHGLGVCAWLCVCCELADRDARRAGYKDQAARAASIAFGKVPGALGAGSR